MKNILKEAIDFTNIYNYDKIFVCKKKYTNFKNILEQKIGVKPRGLWYGVGKSWIEWTGSERPEWLSSYNYMYKIEITDKVLIINTAGKFIKFDEEYSNSSNHFLDKYIDWQRVAEKYSGIEIAPYFYKFRMDRNFFWYYPWDVASGCIWKNDGIKSIKQLYPGDNND